MLAMIHYLFKKWVLTCRWLILPLYFILIISLACSRNKKEAYLNPHLDKKVSLLSDSSFFGGCNDVIFFNDSLLITDVNNNRIVICDTDFNLLANIGSAGEGPGEFRFPMRCCIKNNQIYNFHGSAPALSLFTKEGKFLKRITYPSRFVPDRRFVIDDSSKIFVNHVELDHPIAELDTSGRIVKQFGSFFPSKSVREQRLRAQKHIFLFNEQLICVGVSEPLIEIYTKSGKKVREFDLSQNAAIQKSVDYVESKRQNNPESRETSTSILFSDAYLVNNHLYLLLTAAEKNREVWIPDKILVYSLGTTLELYKALDLDDGNDTMWCTTFAVSADEKRIFAYVANRNEWHVFSIP